MQLNLDLDVEQAARNEFRSLRKEEIQKNKSAIALSRRKKKVNYNPDTNQEFKLMVIDNGTSFSSPNIAIRTTGATYLFNCGDSTQRVIAGTASLRLTSISQLFLTAAHWRNIGGIPGLLMTMHDLGLSHLHIHGPPKVETYLQIQQNTSSAFQHDGTYSMFTFSDSLEKYKDDFVSINSVQIVHAHDSKNVSICYSIKTLARQGKFDNKLAEALGVPKDIRRSKLQKGNPITLDDGTIVTPTQVIGDSAPGKTIWIIEVPTFDHLKDFASELIWDECPDIVVHFTPWMIVNSAEYLKWLTSFDNAKVHHIFLDKELCIYGNIPAVYRYHSMLGVVDSNVFPILHGSLDLPFQSKQIESFPVCNGYIGDTGGVFDAWKTMAWTQENIIRLSSDIKNELLRDDEDLASAVGNLPAVVSTLSSYPRIRCLGTGASVPNKYRNVSSYLFFTSATSCILLDAGEGLITQLVMAYGMERARTIVASVKLIFISHVHADHHLGLINFLSLRSTCVSSDVKCVIVVPSSNFVDYFQNLCTAVAPEVKSQHLALVTSDELSVENSISHINYAIEQSSLAGFSTVEVDHTALRSFGCVLTLTNGDKIVYSGDTMPCNNIKTASEHCRLLIHDATHEDAQSQEAFCTKHSTVTDAVKLAHSANARFILLTHFSQRFSKIPRPAPEMARSNVGVAFDHLDIALDDLNRLPKIFPVLAILFKEFIKDLSESGKRQFLTISKEQIEQFKMNKTQ